jgi:hypothetical protein
MRLRRCRVAMLRVDVSVRSADASVSHVDGSLANSPTPQLPNSPTPQLPKFPTRQLVSRSQPAADAMMQTHSRHRVICCLHATRSRSCSSMRRDPPGPGVGWSLHVHVRRYATACKLSCSFPCAYGYCIEPHHVFSYYSAHISKLPDSPTPLLT